MCSVAAQPPRGIPRSAWMGESWVEPGQNPRLRRQPAVTGISKIDCGSESPLRILRQPAREALFYPNAQHT